MLPWYLECMFRLVYRAIFKSNIRHSYGWCSKDEITILLQQYDWVNHEKHRVLSVNHYIRVLLLLYYTIVSLHRQLYCWCYWSNYCIICGSGNPGGTFSMSDFILAQQCCWRFRYSGKHCGVGYRCHNTLKGHSRVKQSKTSSYAGWYGVLYRYGWWG
jgi:hypothetical protein